MGTGMGKPGVVVVVAVGVGKDGVGMEDGGGTGMGLARGLLGSDLIVTTPPLRWLACTQAAVRSVDR